MLWLFFRFPEFAEFTEYLLHLGKTQKILVHMNEFPVTFIFKLYAIFYIEQEKLLSKSEIYLKNICFKSAK